MKHLAAAIIAALLLLPATAGIALGHHITSTEVVCGQGISASGDSFSTESNSPVTLTGPGSYLETYVVPSSSWSHTFPIGPNGTYSLDWPNSGDNGPVEIEVDCDQVDPTPTPEPGNPTGHASVRCDPDQDPGWILSYGAKNPTDEPIEVVLFLDGVDAGVTPAAIVQPGHDASRFVDYDHQQRVTLYVGEAVVFDRILALPVCSSEDLTPPPTATGPIVAPPSDPAGIRTIVILLGALSLAAVLLATRRRRVA